MQCYHRYVKAAVEEHRVRLGYDRSKVFLNTDLVGQASTTYNSSVSYRSNQWVRCWARRV